MGCKDIGIEKFNLCRVFEKVFEYSLTHTDNFTT